MNHQFIFMEEFHMKKIVAVVAAVALVAGVSFADSKKNAGAFIGIAMPETHVERWQKDGAALLADSLAKRDTRLKMQTATRIRASRISRFRTS